MRLEKNQVATVLPSASSSARLEEMIKSCFKQIGRTRVTGDVPPELAVSLIGAHHHCQRVPSHDGGEALFDSQVTTEYRLLLNRNGVDIGSAELRLPADLVGTCSAHQFIEQKLCPFRTLVGDHGHQGLPPLSGLLRVGVRRAFAPGAETGIDRSVHSVYSVKEYDHILMIHGKHGMLKLYG